MYICHALINALSAHMIHINLNMIFFTHVELSSTKTNYIKYYQLIYQYRDGTDIYIYKFVLVGLCCTCV